MWRNTDCVVLNKVAGIVWRSGNCVVLRTIQFYNVGLCPTQFEIIYAQNYAIPATLCDSCYDFKTMRSVLCYAIPVTARAGHYAIPATLCDCATTAKLCDSCEYLK